MLAIFNLDWDRFSISQQVIEANQFMEELARDVGLSERIIFNCASMGVGEYILPFAKEEKPEDIPSDKLNYLRWHHHHVRQAMQEDRDYRLNHETREMLVSMRRAGHTLIAVFTGATKELEEGLKEARCLDVFEDNVVGYDRLANPRSHDLTCMGLYHQAGALGRIPLCESIIVADQPQGVEEAKYVKPQAVVGYVSSAEEETKKEAHIKDMEGAGADYTLIGGYTVACLPFLFEARADQRASKIAFTNMMNGILRTPR
ncbi:MAG: hypothetical protein WC043_10485 [Pseudobdellovibrionaceae bacterium]